MRSSVLSTIVLSVVIAVGLDAAGVSARALVSLLLTAVAVGSAVLLPTWLLSLGVRSFRELSDDEEEGPLEPEPTRSGVSARRPTVTAAGKVPLPLGP
jgi:hypothetical protein